MSTTATCLVQGHAYKATVNAVVVQGSFGLGVVAPYAHSPPLKLSFKMGAKFRYGLIAKLTEGEVRDGKVGMYLQAETTGLKGRVFADIKLPVAQLDPRDGSFTVFDEEKSDLIRWTWLDGTESPE